MRTGRSSFITECNMRCLKKSEAFNKTDCKFIEYQRSSGQMHKRLKRKKVLKKKHLKTTSKILNNCKSLKANVTSIEELLKVLHISKWIF